MDVEQRILITVEKMTNSKGYIVRVGLSSLSGFAPDFKTEYCARKNALPVVIQGLCAEHIHKFLGDA